MLTAPDLPDLPGALCPQVDPAIWFPTKHDNRTTRLARSICQNCPAIAPCLAYAVNDPSLEGVWAGTTARERMELRRRGRAA